MKDISLAKVYPLLKPGPVVLVTTAHKDRANIMMMSWQTMLEFDPPQLACVISDRNYSFASLRRSGECVIALPSRDLAAKVVKVGNSTGRTINKFKAFGLTPLPAARVRPPPIAECFANLEC
jgi:flavin reductase (DIM6/NTAB) family NADH-FMN oxidoreductase RutF